MEMSSKLTATIILATSIFISFVAKANETELPDAKSLGLTELTDDLSRQQLFKEILLTDPERKQEYDSFALKRSFKFPGDVNYDEYLKVERKDSLFGVDISHHNGKNFPIDQLNTNKSLFVYMKASQGTRFLDPMFATFWSRAGQVDKGIKLHRGAYHFLSSGKASDEAEAYGRAQAKTFVMVIKANGELKPTDMPPVVDVEWDKASSDGPDRWANRKPAEIMAMVRAFSKQVEADLGRKPMIYTAKSWWVGRMGSEASFADLDDHLLWIADYSNSSQASENPRTINKREWVLWQFTDSAALSLGHSKKFDANIYKGKPSEFYSKLGVEEF